jgi:V/A-type H+-transporting ATPase subunit E
MTLDNVIQTILEDGKKDVDNTISDGRKEAERIISEAKRDAGKIKIEKEEEIEKAISRMKIQEIARAEIEAKKLVLTAQKESLDDVYSISLRQVSERWREKLIENILRAKATEVSKGVVYSNEKDKGTVKKLVSAHGGKYGGVIDCLGGVVIDTVDGTIITDYRLESLFQNVWDKSVVDINSILWRGE